MTDVSGCNTGKIRCSVIVPVYNAEKSLRRCIDSILGQTFRDFELILVDDGSSDGSLKILEEYGEKDSRVRVLHQENHGVSAARSAGVKLARGSYIAFVDDDDRIEPEELETVIPEMDRGCDMVSFRYFYRDTGTGAETGIKFQYGEYHISEPAEKRKFLLNVLLQFKIGWSLWSRVYRKDLIDRYQLDFPDVGRVLGEDLYFTLVYCMHAERVKCLDRCLYHYETGGGSIMDKNGNRINAGKMNELAKAVLQHIKRHSECEEYIGMLPVIHFLLQEATVGDLRRKRRMTVRQIRREMLADVEDRSFFLRQLSCVKDHKEEMAEAFEDQKELRLKLRTAEYYAHGKLRDLIYINAAESAAKIYRRLHRNG